MLLSEYRDQRIFFSVERKVRGAYPSFILLFLWAMLTLFAFSLERAYSDTIKDGLFSGTVPSSVANFSWHTERERSSKNISEISRKFSSYFEPDSGKLDIKRDFVVFLSGSYAIENGHLSERLLTWVPEDFRHIISSADVGNKDCSIFPLYVENNQRILIVVANLLREDDEAERICFLYGVRTSLNMPMSEISQYSSDEILQRTITEVRK